jgi:hypothetical protein
MAEETDSELDGEERAQDSFDSAELEKLVARFVSEEVGAIEQKKPEPFDETQAEIDGIDRRLGGVEDEALLPQSEQSSDLERDHEIEPMVDSYTVAVETDNNPDYIGLTYNTGVIRTDTTITKTQAVAGDGYVTLGHWDSSTLTGAQTLTGATYVWDTITVDGYGHVTALTQKDLTASFYTKSEINILLQGIAWDDLTDTMGDPTQAANVGKVGVVTYDGAGYFLTLVDGTDSVKLLRIPCDDGSTLSCYAYHGRLVDARP